MMARLRLTTKQVNGGYYKGNRTGSMGFFAKNGSYVIDWKKVRTYAVPENLKEFKVCFFRNPCLCLDRRLKSNFLAHAVRDEPHASHEKQVHQGC